MSRASLNTPSVLRRTRFSQVLFGVFALAAGAIAAVGLPRAPQPRPEDLALPVLPALDSKDGQSSRENPDFQGASMRLSLVANAPKKPEPMVVEPPSGEETAVQPAPEPTPTPQDSVRYLGTMSFGRMQLALVSVNEKQRFAKLNDIVEGDQRLTSIEKDFIVIAGEHDSRQIDIAPKGSEVVTRFAARAGSAMNPSGMAGGVALKPGRRGQNPAAINAAVNATANAAAMRAIQQPPRINGPDETAILQAKRFDLVRDQLKSTGKFQDENELNEAARAQSAYPDPAIDAKLKGQK